MKVIILLFYIILVTFIGCVYGTDYIVVETLAPTHITNHTAVFVGSTNIEILPRNALRTLDVFETSKGTLAEIKCYFEYGPIFAPYYQDTVPTKCAPIVESKASELTEDTVFKYRLVMQIGNLTIISSGVEITTKN